MKRFTGGPCYQSGKFYGFMKFEFFASKFLKNEMWKSLKNDSFFNGETTSFLIILMQKIHSMEFPRFSWFCSENAWKSRCFQQHRDNAKKCRQSTAFWKKLHLLLFEFSQNENLKMQKRKKCRQSTAFWKKLHKLLFEFSQNENLKMQKRQFDTDTTAIFQKARWTGDIFICFLVKMSIGIFP